MALLWLAGLVKLGLQWLDGIPSLIWPWSAGLGAIGGLLLIGRFHRFRWIALPMLLGLAGLLVDWPHKGWPLPSAWRCQRIVRPVGLALWRGNPGLSVHQAVGAGAALHCAGWVRGSPASRRQFARLRTAHSDRSSRDQSGMGSVRPVRTGLMAHAMRQSAGLYPDWLALPHGNPCLAGADHLNAGGLAHRVWVETDRLVASRAAFGQCWTEFGHGVRRHWSGSGTRCQRWPGGGDRYGRSADCCTDWR